MNPLRSAARSRATTLLGLAACLSAASCFTTTVKSGAPATAPAIEYDEKWHSGLIVGIAELSGPYDLSRICPGGWAEIKTETSFVNGLVQALTSGIYNPQTVTVRCAAGAPGPNVSGAPPAMGSMAPGSPSLAAPPASPPAPAPAPVAPPPAH